MQYKALRRDAKRVLSRFLRSYQQAIEFAAISMYHGKAGIAENDVFVAILTTAPPS